jgi:hypothetical protein
MSKDFSYEAFTEFMKHLTTDYQIAANYMQESTCAIETMLDCLEAQVDAEPDYANAEDMLNSIRSM